MNTNRKLRGAGASKSNSATAIIRRSQSGSGFSVMIEPAPDGGTFDREYPTHSEARGYAGGLRLVRGWPINDQTRETDRG